jgi:hypothetical protein
MPIAMRCPGCDTRFEFASDLEGRRIKCKTCGDVFRVERPVRKLRADEDDRRTRRRDDPDRPSGRHRRPADESDDDLPRRDEDDVRKAGRPGLAIALIVGLLVLVTVGVVAVVLLSRGKKSGGTVDPGDIVLTPAKSCPLEVPEKDADLLAIPNSGNLFGVFRAQGTVFKKTWTYDAYDLALGRRVGRVDLTGVEDLKAFSLSPDGKRLLVVESRGFGWGVDHKATVWSVADGKNLTPDKWAPFPRKGGASEDLYRMEFVAPDLIVAVGNHRSVYRYQVPTFDVSTDRVSGTQDELGRRFGAVPDDLHRLQYQLAFSADRKRMAVWNGNGYTVVETRGGGEAFATPGVKQTARELWGGDRAAANVRGGGVAFSPDGKALAAIVSNDSGNRKHILFVWELRTEEADPVSAFEIPTNQFHDSTSLSWWGNRFVVTGGSKVEGMLIDLRTGRARRQLMGPEYNRYGFGRDGRLWYAASRERTVPATVYVVDGPDPAVLQEPEDYEQIVELNQEFFLKRLWLEPAGVLRKPTRYAPDLHKRLIRRP